MLVIFKIQIANILLAWWMGLRKTGCILGQFWLPWILGSKPRPSPESMYSSLLATKNSYSCASGDTSQDYNPVCDIVVSLFCSLGGRWIISFLWCVDKYTIKHPAGFWISSLLGSIKDFLPAVELLLAQGSLFCFSLEMHLILVWEEECHHSSTLVEE